MFSFDGIVLKKTTIKDSKILISIFSKQYGKISAWYKQSKKRLLIDVGSVYNFSSSTDKAVCTLDTIKSSHIIDTTALDFKGINNILSVCSFLEKTLPPGVAYESIYTDYLSSVCFLESSEDNKKIYPYIMIRFLKKLGIAKNPSATGNLNLHKLFSVADKYEIETLMSIKGLSINDYNSISEFNDSVLFNYLN